MKFDAVGAEILCKLVGDKHSFHNPKSRAYDVTHPIAERNREVPKAVYLNFRGQSQVQSFYRFNAQNVIKAIKLFMEGKIIEIQNDNKVNVIATSYQSCKSGLASRAEFGFGPKVEKNFGLNSGLRRAFCLRCTKIQSK